MTGQHWSGSGAVPRGKSTVRNVHRDFKAEAEIDRLRGLPGHGASPLVDVAVDGRPAALEAQRQVIVTKSRRSRSFPCTQPCASRHRTRRHDDIATRRSSCSSPPGLVHLQPGSVRVKAGDRVWRGQLLARLGNSGDARWPHLQFQVTDKADVMGSEGLPYLFDSFRSKADGQQWERRTGEYPMGRWWSTLARILRLHEHTTRAR